jgi:hypothetical protein
LFGDDDETADMCACRLVTASSPSFSLEEFRVRYPTAALLWLPREGQVLARFTGPNVWWWLHQACKVRSPEPDADKVYWHLSRNSLNAVLRASLDRFGVAILVRDAKRLAVCNVQCQEASGFDCACSCLGQEHGSAGGREWVEVGDSSQMLLAEGHLRVVRVLLAPSGTADQPRLYANELVNQQYTTLPSQRSERRWPKAHEFICASCATEQARVWDHCHRHGYVRAPLCNPCNTRDWRGWAIEYGRTTPLENVDMSYHRNCPWYGHQGREGPCTA